MISITAVLLYGDTIKQYSQGSVEFFDFRKIAASIKLNYPVRTNVPGIPSLQPFFVEAEDHLVAGLNAKLTTEFRWDHQSARFA